MSTPSIPASEPDSLSPIAPAPPWWAPQGSGTPPDSWPVPDTGQPRGATATPAVWQPAEPAAAPPPTYAALVPGRHARRPAGRRPRIRTGVALVATVFLGVGAGAGIAAAAVDNDGAGTRVDRGAVANSDTGNGPVGVPRGASFPGPRERK
jgi:hypothetical protein